MSQDSQLDPVESLKQFAQALESKELAKIVEVTKLTLADDEFLIVQIPSTMTNEYAQKFYAHLSQIFGPQRAKRIMIIRGDSQIKYTNVKFPAGSSPGGELSDETQEDTE